MSRAVAAVTDGPIVHRNVNGKIFNTVPFPLFFDVVDMLEYCLCIASCEETNKDGSREAGYRLATKDGGWKSWKWVENVGHLCPSIDVILTFIRLNSSSFVPVTRCTSLVVCIARYGGMGPNGQETMCWSEYGNACDIDATRSSKSK
jgi:hypothetical protein